MKWITISLICLLYSAFLIGCKKHGTKIGEAQIIEVNVRDKETELQIEIDHIIPLETNDNTLIGYTTKVVWYNNHIIVLDDYRSKAMFIFDESGRLIYRTKTGKGPNELVSASAMNINRMDSSIQLFDETQRIIYSISFKGKFLDYRFVPPEVFIIDFSPMSGDTVLVYYSGKLNDDGLEDKQTTYILYSKNFTSRKNLELYVNSNKFANAMLSPVDIKNGEVLFVAPWSYNIYELKGNNFEIKYKIDFGKDALSEDQIESLSSYELLPMIHNSIFNKVGSLQSIFQHEDHILIYAEYGDYGLNVLYSKKNQKAYNLNSYILKGILPVCKVWGFKQDGSIYAVVKAEDFINFSKKSDRYNQLKISSNDNPILISFKVLEY